MKKKVFSVIIFSLMLITCFFSPKNNGKIMIDKKEMASGKVDDYYMLERESMFYSVNLLDDKMTEHEKAIVLAQFLQEGSIYEEHPGKLHDVFHDHTNDRDEYNETFYDLATNAGLNCEKVQLTNNYTEEFIVCNLDGEWTYMDAVKSDNESYQKIDSSLWFKSRSEMQQINPSLYHFDDVYDSYGSLFSRENGESFPEGKTYQVDNYSSRVHYDDNYMYYEKNIGTTGKLYRKNRTTKVEEGITDVLYNEKGSGLAKDENTLYYVGTDNSLYSVSTSSIKFPTKVVSSTSSKKITAVFLQEGYISYSLYDQSSKQTEIVKYKKVSDWPVKKTYELNDSTHKYNLDYLEAKDKISILSAVGIGDNLPSGEIYVPNTIDGKKVIGIGENAYDAQDGSNFTGELVIPDNIIYVGQSAFAKNKQFTGIKLGKNLKSICHSAFSPDFDYEVFHVLPSLEIPSSVTYIGTYAFGGYDIYNLKINTKKLKYYNPGIFWFVYGELIVPEGVEYLALNSIGTGTLDMVVLPSSLKEIGYASVSAKNVFIKSKDLDFLAFPQDGLPCKRYAYKGSKTARLLAEEYLDVYDIEVQDIYLDKTELNVEKGAKPVTLKYELGTTYYFDNPTITWESEDSSVATVDQEGKVTFHNGGSTNIIVKNSNNGIAKCKVYVHDGFIPEVPIQGVTVSEKNIKLRIGETYKLDATITPDDTTASKHVKWETWNELVATVDTDGIVTARGYGETDIYVRASSGHYDHCHVNVIPYDIEEKPIESVTLKEENVTLKVGDFYKIEATILPSDTTDSKNLTLNSDAPDVVEVFNGVEIHAKGPGVANITVETSNGKKATCQVTVIQEIKNITLTPTELNLKLNQTYNLKATVTPDNATDKDNLWSSNHDNIVHVDQKGKVTAKSVGNAIITVKTANNKMATCSITVTDKNTSKYKKGDVNRDDYVDVKDAREALSISVGTRPITSEDIDVADFNGNKMIESSDAIEILRLYLDKE